MKYLTIVGGCGSIGLQALDVVRKSNDSFKVVGLSLGSNLEIAKSIVEEFKPEIICFKNKEDKIDLSYNPIIVYGDEGLLEIAKYSKYENELFINSLVGIAGLMPTIEAIKAKKNIALANKETLVVAGDIVKDYIKKYNVELLPIDSEHSAILTCLKGENNKQIKRLIITASGGSFRDLSRCELENVTKDDALNHPNWKMGPKITIDSATMMNKGFEVIEAHYLFDIPYEKIDTIMHKQSIVHSMVEYDDTTIKASLGCADMRNPISYALNYPNHLDIGLESLDLFDLSLDFKKLDKNRFPCLEYAYMAAKKGGIYLAVLNAANEAAVKLFLNNKIKFLQIEEIIYNEITNTIYENIEYNLENIISVSYEIMNKVVKKYWS